MRYLFLLGAAGAALIPFAVAAQTAPATTSDTS
ncbi:MAG: hypothetical protein JWR80_4533, partial [Bradyrhizobium sp.]|nr:hypothetical protein [Bradyrhizobium sp.]MDB5674118.1 hypothetical protein [Sphingomonas bacterium]